MIEMETKAIDKVTTSVRNLAKSLRSVRKELHPHQLNKEREVREGRALRLRDRVRGGIRAALVIQRAYRGYRVRRAVMEGGNFWTELWDEAEQVVYYYNTWSEEYARRLTNWRTCDN